MAFYQRSGMVRSATALSLVAGIWAIIAPYSFSAGLGAEWNGWIFGVLIVLCSFGAMMAPQVRGYNVANLIWGVWLILSGWAMGAAGGGLRWSNVITGLVVIGAAWMALRYAGMIATMPEAGAGPTRRAA